MNNINSSGISTPTNNLSHQDLRELRSAIETLDLRRFQALTSTTGFDINAQNGRGDTVLHFLAREMSNGRLDRVPAWGDELENFLDRYGVDVDWNLLNEVNNTALHLMDIHHRTVLLRMVDPYVPDEDSSRSDSQRSDEQTDNGDGAALEEEMMAALARLRARQMLSQTPSEKFLGKKQDRDSH